MVSKAALLAVALAALCAALGARPALATARSLEGADAAAVELLAASFPATPVVPVDDARFAALMADEESGEGGAEESTEESGEGSEESSEESSEEATEEATEESSRGLGYDVSKATLHKGRNSVLVPTTAVVRDGRRNVKKIAQDQLGDDAPAVVSAKVSKVSRECPRRACHSKSTCPLKGGVCCGGGTHCCPEGATCLTTNPPTCVHDTEADVNRCAEEECMLRHHCPYDDVATCCVGGDSCCQPGFKCRASVPPTCEKILTAAELKQHQLMEEQLLADKKKDIANNIAALNSQSNKEEQARVDKHTAELQAGEQLFKKNLDLSKNAHDARERANAKAAADLYEQAVRENNEKKALLDAARADREREAADEAKEKTADTEKRIEAHAKLVGHADAMEADRKRKDNELLAKQADDRKQSELKEKSEVKAKEEGKKAIDAQKQKVEEGEKAERKRLQEIANKLQEEHGKRTAKEAGEKAVANEQNAKNKAQAEQQEQAQKNEAITKHNANVKAEADAKEQANKRDSEAKRKEETAKQEAAARLEGERREQATKAEETTKRRDEADTKRREQEQKNSERVQQLNREEQALKAGVAEAAQKKEAETAVWGWRRVANNVCFRANQPNTRPHVDSARFTVNGGRGASVTGWRIHFVSGGVTCANGNLHGSNWGCAGMSQISTFIVNANNQIVAPTHATAGFRDADIGPAINGQHMWYELAGGPNGAGTLEFQSQPGWSVQGETEFRIMYGEVIGQWTLGDNNGQTCAHIDAFYGAGGRPDVAPQGNGGHLVVSRNRNPTQGGLIAHGGQLPLQNNVRSFSMWLYVHGVHGPWSNVIHTGENDNQRTPAMWLYPGGTRLHIRSASGGDWNAGCDPGASLPVGQWTHVAFAHQAGIMVVYYNGFEVGRCGSGHLHAHVARTWLSNPWYVPASVTVSDLRYANTFFSHQEVINIMRANQRF